MPSDEQLGTVTSRSGILIFIDTGSLKVWSHDRPPLMPEGVLSSGVPRRLRFCVGRGGGELTAKANSSVDLRIIGADAERAGRILDVSWPPFYSYDQPPEDLQLQRKLEKLAREHGLDARFEVMNPRIAHGRRVDLRPTRRKSTPARAKAALSGDPANPASSGGPGSGARLRQRRWASAVSRDVGGSGERRPQVSATSDFGHTLRCMLIEKPCCRRLTRILGQNSLKRYGTGRIVGIFRLRAHQHLDIAVIEALRSR